jgi:hypothetical protein
MRLNEIKNLFLEIKQLKNKNLKGSQWGTEISKIKWKLKRYNIKLTNTEIYNIMNNIPRKQVKLCPNCNKPLEVESISKGYKEYCSVKCKRNHNKKYSLEEIREVRKLLKSYSKLSGEELAPKIKEKYYENR